ncbi:DNA polymerase-3 subunit alpha [Catenuloplanes nepalensis]|uniref:DNA polymerase III subunit alpha n=1 Tax=Catenuloplanes nepalensis TaxID=587533 RepID=A0ABT9MM29_9ACTN|nr:DNA polymerase III subunit alpha [Catenuloplanes nepalensis]MDP9792479.1 DNA polymerase-3 subunit alpha [Catenuloplanes nepalensis]
MAESFVHLHVHTEYSMLDGAARIKEVMAEAARLGMPAAAITDHGNLYGAYDFYHQAVAAGVKPIIGIEPYVAPESRFDKKRIRWGSPEQKKDDVSGSGAYTHMTMWARNPAGLKNLMKLSSLASIEGQFGKWPRMDFNLIAEHAEGIMGTTGCPSGAVQTRLRLGQFDEALKSAAQYQEVLGRDNYFLEIMDHGIEIERRVRDGLLEIGRKLGIKPVVTNDSHYTHEHQAKAHDVLLCVQTGSNVADPNRFRFDGSGYFVKPAEQMRAMDSSEAWQQGCSNTLLIAERVESYKPIFTEVNRMPLFEVPEGETQESWLEKETWRGLDRRFPDGIPDGYRERIRYELGIIFQMGFPSYFLVVADLLRFAREEKIRYAPGRGSATGCLVAYALEIIELDPIYHGLIFERFLNPERVSMPDIDLDFDESRRSEIIAYVNQKYGTDKVCQIVTFGTIKSKAALKDATRVLGFPYAIGDKLTKAMPPPVMAKDIPLSGITDSQHPRYAEAAEFRALLASSPEYQQIYDTAVGIEGLIRQTGVHAAGTILSRESLQDVIPVVARPDDGMIISAWDYPACESLGLLKMDFLGLRNLKIIDDAIFNIRQNHDPEFDWSAHRLEDKKTYELLATGDTLGVFQLDGGPMRNLLKAMEPTEYVDIAAVLALYRPGPMAANAHIDYADRKNGRKPVVPIHEEFRETLGEILDPTYGLIVFQEQVLAIARKAAGYSLGRADLLRRAMGKKKKSVLDEEFVGFEAGMKANQYSDEAIKTLWDILLPFAGYAFNKSHTAGYGVLSFWTAFMKANYPAEYMSALLTSVGDDQKKMAVYLAECRRMGITVLPPDVNESSGPFTPVDGNIRFGLQAVRNVGANVVDSVIATRSTKGAFDDFNDFIEKIEIVACNKRVVESLIKAGAFDSMGHTRKGLLEHHEAAIDIAVEVKKREAFGQYDLFSGMMEADNSATGGVGLPAEYSAEEWDRRTKLAFEREMLGLYVSDHPLAGAERILKRESDTLIAEIGDDTPDRANVVLAGLISGIERRTNKAGALWAIVKLEDLTGSIEVLFFPKNYELIGHELITDRIIAVQGRVNHRENATSVFGSDMKVLELSDSDLAANPPVTITMDLPRVTTALTEDLRRILGSYPGKSPVHMRLRDGSRTMLLDLKNHRVEASVNLSSELKALLGAGCLE